MDRPDVRDYFADNKLLGASVSESAGELELVLSFDGVNLQGVIGTVPDGPGPRLPRPRTSAAGVAREVMARPRLGIRLDHADNLRSLLLRSHVVGDDRAADPVGVLRDHVQEGLPLHLLRV